ncbi:MAG TPA: penicillin-binding protein 1B [Xanthomonadales bacterium]|nr:penicillin-binding protein 1B [Xanthomonadales bacterium]
MARKAPSRKKKKTSRKAAASKRATNRPTSKAARRSKRKPSRASRIFRFALLVFGVGFGLLVPWTIYLDHQVRTEFEGRKWDLPSRVYARPLELYPGLAITPTMLTAELRAAGYSKTGSPARPGQYSVNGNRFAIFKRPFRFPEGEDPARLIRVDVPANSVGNLQDGRSSEPLSLVRLDPAEIASIYPLLREDRTLVRLKNAPELLVTGLQAVEDRNFKHHHGLDPRGIARALWANIRAGQTIQGGSTLTQQLVKNYFLTADQTIVRKANEAMMALILEWHYDKSQILEAYINEVFLGQQGGTAIHGFARASRFYFDQPLKHLSESEIALLIGMVKGPSYYNPRRHPERAKTRRNAVLQMMLETGLISSAEAEAAFNSPLGVVAAPPGNRQKYSAFIQLVRRQLAREFEEDDLKTEGLRVFTTLAPSEQAAAQNAVTDGLGWLGRNGMSETLDGAMVVADVSSGEIRAVVGGRNPAQAGFNRALDARRQVGSVIKPLVYLLALEHESEYNLASRLQDEPITLRQPNGKEWSPSNYDNKSHGEVSLMQALAQSYNQATVRLGLDIGVTSLLHRIEQLGVRAEIEAVPSVFLGAVELTPLEVAQLYQPLAANGYSVPLRAVVAVETPQGAELTRYPLRLMPQPHREAIAVLNYALTRVVTDGTARSLPGMLNNNASIAGKTGTTNDRRDSWFVGYTRNRLAVTWVGEDDNRPAGVTGSNAAMRLWAGLFSEIPVEPVDLRLPDGAHWAWVDDVSGAISDEACGGATQLPFVDGSEPQVMTPCLAARVEQKDESFWRKWFGKKKD